MIDDITATTNTDPDPDPEDNTQQQQHHHIININEHFSLSDDDKIYTWNENHEILLKRWSKIAYFSMILHNRSGKYYKSRDKWIGIPGVVLTAASGGMSFLGTLDVQLWFFIFIGFTAMTAAGFVAAHNYLEYERTASRHFLASKVYHGIYNDIEEQLSYEVSQRSNVKSFTRYIKGCLKSAQSSVADIPHHIFTKYAHEIENGTQFCPTTTKVEHEHEQKEKDPHTLLQPENAAPIVTNDDTADDLQSEYMEELEKALQKQRRISQDYQMKRFESIMELLNK